MIDLGKLPGALRGLAYTLKKYEVAKSPSHSGNRDWLGPLLWLEIESFLINIGYEPEARGDEPLGVVGFQNIMMQAIKQKGGDE